MPLTTLPLIAYGAAEDVSTWSQNGTCGATGSVADPFGGTGAYDLTDNDGAAFEYRYKEWTETVGGTVTVGVFLKDASGDFGLVIRDHTAGAYRHWATYSFSGSVIDAGNTETGAGTIYTPIAVGSGWYLCLLSASSCVAGNVHRLWLLPGNGSTSATGTTSVYVRNVCLFDYADEVTSFARPREGSAWAQAASGTESAWIQGTDEILSARLRWIPKDPTTSPVLKHGWYGANEVAGVNMGAKALLTAGRAKTSLTWVPDRAACSTNQAGYLAEPMTDGVELEPNGDRAVRIEIRGSSVFRGV